MTYQHDESALPAHNSPFLSATPQHPSKYIHNLNLNELDNHKASRGSGLPDNLISPAFTPPLTPTRSGARTPSGDEHLHKEPESFPVDTSLDDPETTQKPKLLQELPKIECVVRARIPTTSGAEMFLYLYTNDTDNKEHLAIVFGDTIRSRSLDAEKPGETEMDRMIRGAYVGRLTPGRTSSRLDPKSPRPRHIAETRARGSSLKNVTVPDDLSLDNTTTHHHQPSALSSSLSPDDISSRSPKSSADSLSSAIERVKITTPQKSTSNAPLVRIHSECYTGETAWSARCDCGEQLDEAARLMSLPSVSPHPGGVIVYLRQEGRGIGLASKLKAYNLQDLGNDTVEANLLLRHPADARTYGLATAILQDLGMGTDEDEKKPANERGIRLLTNNPDKVRAVEGNNREVRVVERVAMVPIAWSSGGMKGVKGAEIEKYLQTKIGRMGHMLER